MHGIQKCMSCQPFEESLGLLCGSKGFVRTEVCRFPSAVEITRTYVLSKNVPIGCVAFWVFLGKVKRKSHSDHLNYVSHGITLLP